MSLDEESLSSWLIPEGMTDGCLQPPSSPVEKSSVAERNGDLASASQNPPEG